MNARLLVALLAICEIVVGCAETPSRLGGAPKETVIYAVGDIADCGNKPISEASAVRTAELLRPTKGPILALGDIAYPTGSTADFSNCFQPTWGDLKSRILPVPGNHEYKTAEAGDYYSFFGAAAGERGKGYYSTHIGGWRIIALNSNIDAQAGSRQAEWLRAELAANKTKCTLAFWHHPLFASNPRGNDSKMRDVWQALYEADVDVVLNGHEHLYERFAPLNPDGAVDPSRGIREFIVGTGGASLYRFLGAHSHSEARKSEVLGVLELTLREDSYAWKFLSVAGQTFEESGEGRCH